MKTSTTQNLRMKGNTVIVLMAFLLSSATSFAQLTVTKSYTAPSSVSIDGCGSYCTNLPGVTFSAADFTAGVCLVADVNVSITWAKTDGSCTAPGTGSSFHNETSFRIDGPVGNEILVVPGAYTGSATISTVTTTLDQAAASIIGGTTPTSGTFRPNNGDLDNYIGTDPFGTWTLRAGDTGGGDPLCVVGYSVTITMSAAVDADGDGFTNCSGDCDDSDPLINPGMTEILCDGIDNDCNPTTLDDPTPPTAICQSINAYLDGSGLAAITAADIDLGSSDNCTAITMGVSPSSFTCADLGAQTVILTVTDGIGNTAFCSAAVMVIDSLAPIGDLSTLPDVNGSCEVTSLVPPTASDNCTGASVTITNDATLPIDTLGTTIVTWTYDDGNGNTSVQTQNVVIVDTIAPVADSLALPDLLSDCEGSLNPPTATDVCNGAITGTTATTFPVTTQGTTVVTWTFDDGNGNISTQDQSIILADIATPVADIAILSDFNAICEATPPAPTGVDACAGVVTATSTTTFPITTIGTTTITWTYDDGNGNTYDQVQDIVVTNITATTTATMDGVTLTSDITGDSYQWINCDGNTPIVGATNANYTATANGSYAVIVTDASCVDTSACATVTTVSVNTLIIDNLKLYPNPTRDGFFNVTFDGVINSITVLDMLGREIPVEVDIYSGSVNASTLNNGRYMVRIETNKGTKVTEIIISM
ncbi:MAG: T9SS type A sorting domain-containing protein [Crocinitomicaceae bacterium]|nr:T9SS type A sorting domain-containing protein [Flavobacteriales bacterium]NQZ34610.1 T9SS type A sorting domain-containing protein [Crocinitomicaceae bacterium]